MPLWQLWVGSCWLRGLLLVSLIAAWPYSVALCNLADCASDSQARLQAGQEECAETQTATHTPWPGAAEKLAGGVLGQLQIPGHHTLQPLCLGSQHRTGRWPGLVQRYPEVKLCVTALHTKIIV